jgi:thiamine biosynthesis lipoprotein
MNFVMADKRTRTTNRRQFLKGQSALDAIEDIADGISNTDEYTASPPPLSVLPTPETYLLNVSRNAMACEFVVHLNAGQHTDAVETAVAALDLVERLETQMTIYRDDSEVSLLNARAASESVIVEEGLYHLLQRAKELHGVTDGAFDVTAGPLSKTWGFYRRQGRIPEDREIEAALELVGSDKLHLNTNSAGNAIRFDLPGMEINLGGIGKGYALDRAAQLLTHAGVEDFVIHGGQSSVLARGSRQGSPTDAWQVNIRHPLRDERLVASFLLRDRAVGTSGPARQSFYYRGRRYGHILDPRTGHPVDGVHSCSVVANDAATADALSTAFFVLGVGKAMEFCQKHSDVGALFVCDGSKAGTVRLERINLPEDEAIVHGERL